MRILSTGLVLAGLLASHVAAAAPCTQPEEHIAFDIAGLKTMLMVTALTCTEANPKYNAFIAKYRPELTANERHMNAYFTRAYGRSAAKQRDDYITQLANSQSEAGLKAGSLLCDRNVGMFDEVLALKSGTELPDYAGGRSVAQPISMPGCTGTPERSPARSTARRRS